MVSDFQSYFCSNLENENTLVIEMRKQFTKAAKGCFSNLRLAGIIKIILKYLWMSQIFKLIQMNTF